MLSKTFVALSAFVAATLAQVPFGPAMFETGLDPQMCLTAATGLENGSPVVIQECNPQLLQRFFLSAGLVTVNGTHCLDVVEGSDAALLRELGEWRRRAAAHIAAASQTIQAMSEEMEDLRERVAAPDLMGDAIPMEVHMKSIRAGLERLQQGRTRAQEREEETVRRLLGVGDEDN